MYSVIGFGLASFLLIAVYMFLNGQQHSQLPQCWLFEPDDDGTCDKVCTASHSSFMPFISKTHLYAHGCP